MFKRILLWLLDLLRYAMAGQVEAEKRKADDEIDAMPMDPGDADDIARRLAAQRMRSKD